MQLPSLKKFIPALLGSAFFLAVSAVPAADLSAENSQDQLCIPVTNAVSYLFVPEPQPPRLSCKLASLKKLNDDAVKKWQEKNRDSIKKCIFDTICGRNQFALLGYDVDNEIIDPAEAIKKAKAMPRTDSAEYYRKITPQKTEIETEFNAIQDVYETELVFTADGEEAPPGKWRAFRTGKSLYICSEGDLHCAPLQSMDLPGLRLFRLPSCLLRCPFRRPSRFFCGLFLSVTCHPGSLTHFYRTGVFRYTLKALKTIA